MTKVWCADNGCRFNDENLCTAKKINLSWCSVMTVHDGRQEYHRCRMRESPAEFRRKKEQEMVETYAKDDQEGSR